VRSALLVIAASAVLVSGCGGSGAGPTLGSAASVSSASVSIDPQFDTGQVVLLTGSTVHPLWLVSLLGKPIEFRNVSDTTQSVRFDNGTVRSGPIAPGKSYRYTPDAAVSISYHAGATQGRIQVTPLEEDTAP
jgi:hypothetical protein